MGTTDARWFENPDDRLMTVQSICNTARAFSATSSNSRRRQECGPLSVGRSARPCPRISVRSCSRISVATHPSPRNHSQQFTLLSTSLFRAFVGFRPRNSGPVDRDVDRQLSRRPNRRGPRREELRFRPRMPTVWAGLTPTSIVGVGSLAGGDVPVTTEGGDLVPSWRLAGVPRST